MYDKYQVLLATLIRTFADVCCAYAICIGITGIRLYAIVSDQCVHIVCL